MVNLQLISRTARKRSVSNHFKRENFDYVAFPTQKSIFTLMAESMNDLVSTKYIVVHSSEME